MAEPESPMDRVVGVIFFRWWGALLVAVALFALAYSIFPAPPADPEKARAFKANVQQFLIAVATGLCGLGMLVVAGMNLFGKGGEGEPAGQAPPG